MSTLLLLILVAEMLIAGVLAILIVLIALRLPVRDMLAGTISNRRARKTERVRVRVLLRNSDVYTGELVRVIGEGCFNGHELVLLPPLEVPSSAPFTSLQQVVVPVSEIRALWVEARTPRAVDTPQLIFDSSQEERAERTIVAARATTSLTAVSMQPPETATLHPGALAHPLVVPAEAMDTFVSLPPSEYVLTAKTKFAMDKRRRDETVRQVETVIMNAGIRGEVIEYRKEVNSWHFIFEASQEVDPAIVSTLAEMVRSRLYVADASAGVETEAHRNIIDIDIRPPTKVQIANVLPQRPANKPLAIALGEDLAGNPVILDLTELVHLFIAGSSRSALDEVLDLLLANLLLANPPNRLKLMVFSSADARLRRFEKLPHLPHTTYGIDDVVNSLQWLSDELDSRFKLLGDLNCRTIEDYNLGCKQVSARNPLPPIVVVVEEIDYIMQHHPNPQVAEDTLARVTNIGSFVGIHLVVATGEPPPGMIGLIIENIKARLALAVSSAAHSEWIIETADAKELEGTDDMILKRPTSASMLHLSRAHVTAAELRRIISHWTGVYDDSELLLQAAELIVNTQFGSTSMLQRKLRIGFAKAGLLMDRLENCGIVGPTHGSKARDVLVQPDDLPGILERLNPMPDEGGNVL